MGFEEINIKMKLTFNKKLIKTFYVFINILIVLWDSVRTMLSFLGVELW